jgi:hypothetical protein
VLAERLIFLLTPLQHYVSLFVQLSIGLGCTYFVSFATRFRTIIPATKALLPCTRLTIEFTMRFHRRFRPVWINFRGESTFLSFFVLLL